MKKLFSSIKKWWEGTYVPEPPGSPLYFGIYQKHWSSELAHSIWNMLKKYQQWLFGIALGSLFTVLFEKILS